jgi:hypothetical protein
MAKDKALATQQGETSLALAESYPMFDPTLDIRSVVTANLGGGGASRFDLERVTIPAGGGQIWTLPSLDGKAKGSPSIVGVVIDVKQARAYWSRPLEEGGGAEPDCKSDDCINGKGQPGGHCEDCQFAQWASDPKGGNGQACKIKATVLIVPVGSILPIALELPATSIKEWRKFALTKLTNARRPYWSVEVEVTLATRDKPVKHSVAQFGVARMMDENETVQARAYGDAILASLK